MAALRKKDEEEFIRAREQIADLLEPNEMAEIVSRKLYMTKGEVWHARYEMSGYEIGRVKLDDLLRHFVFATSEIELPKKITRKDKGQIYLRLMDAMREAVRVLKTIRAAEKI